MWQKKPPTSPGWYWARRTSLLTNKEFIRPVRLYEQSRGMWTAYCDGDNFMPEDFTFIAWWPERIAEPPETSA